MKKTVFANTKFMQRARQKLKRKAKRLTTASKEVYLRLRGLASK